MEANRVARPIVAEGIGTALLLAAVVGSGIMGERLAGGNMAIALLANTLATGAALVTLILAFGPVSGGHFNPAVTLADASQGGLPWRRVPGYICAQVSGAVIGVWTAHLMFAERVFMLSRHARSGPAQVFSEVVATFGLLAVIWGCSRRRSDAVPFAVGAYITAAYWFTASTSFANPAVTLARAHGYLCRYPPGRRPRIHPRAAAGRHGGDVAVPVVGSDVASDCRGCHRAALRTDASMTTVLFACTHNAGRSQMAATFFNALANPRKAQAISAGTRPADRVHSKVVLVMRELGIDLADAKPARLTPELAQQAQMLVTMGCGDECPYVPGAKRDDWPLGDPKGQPVERVRAIRDEIRSRVEALLDTEGWR